MLQSIGLYYHAKIKIYGSVSEKMSKHPDPLTLEIRACALKDAAKAQPQ